MTADRLLALYDRVADAPDAVSRLRRFVLDLAVRGKLVEQNLTDEPASELLKQIAAEQARLKEKGEFREPRSAVEINRHELPFRSPEPWPWVRLIDIASVRYGFAFKSSQFNADRRGMPLIRIRDISKTDTEAYFEGDYDPVYIVRASDYLVGMDGDFNLHRWKGKDGLLNQRVMRINGWRYGVNPEFVRLPLQVVLNYLHGGTSLTTVKHLSAKQVNGTEIPLPPLDEQYRIVSKVDELMALCDRLEEARTVREDTRDRLTLASLTRLSTPDTDVPTFRSHARFAVDALPALTARADQVKHLRQAILSLAVCGKLVEQNPADEPALELLKRITEDKKQRAVSARDRRAGSVEPIDSREISYGLPSSWVWASFGDITISRDGERVPVSKAKRESRAKIYNYYGASGVIDKIDGYLFDKPLLLVGEDGANLINRSTPIAFIARGKYWVNNHAHVLDGLSENCLQYLELFINATDLKPFVTGTAQPKMNQGKMNSIPVALPPLAEQYRIVAKIDALMALCDQIEASLSAADTTRHRLLESLLQETLEPAA